MRSISPKIFAFFLFSYSQTTGARPLNRVISKRLLNPMADALLAGAIRNGETVNVGVEEGELVVRKNHEVGSA